MSDWPEDQGECSTTEPQSYYSLLAGLGMLISLEHLAEMINFILVDKSCHSAQLFCYAY